VFVESESLFVVVLRRRGCAMHRMTPVCWKQFMMRLEDTWFVAAFFFTPMHDPGL